MSNKQVRLTPEAHQAAKVMSARDGKTLETWLSGLVLEEWTGEPQVATEIAERLGGDPPRRKNAAKKSEVVCNCGQYGQRLHLHTCPARPVEV